MVKFRSRWLTVRLVWKINEKTTKKTERWILSRRNTDFDCTKNFHESQYLKNICVHRRYLGDCFQALTRILQLVRQDLERERRSKEGLDTLANAMLHSSGPKHDDSNNKNISEKLRHVSLPNAHLLQGWFRGRIYIHIGFSAFDFIHFWRGHVLWLRIGKTIFFRLFKKYFLTISVLRTAQRLHVQPSVKNILIG